MKDTSRVLRLLVALATLALFTACDSGSGETETPGTDVTESPDIQEQVDVPPSTGACHECIAVGMGFRFAELEVTEPADPIQLPDFLNMIWRPDVASSRLNIMLQVTEIVDNGDGTKTLTFKAGSGWHDLTVEDVLPVEGGATPNEYHFVGPEPTEFTALLLDDCTFATQGDSNKLQFHPGPEDHAFVCSAGDDSIDLPQDTIPIANLVATGTIADSCEGINFGHLDGCIAEEAAGQICSFGAAPDYSAYMYEQDETVDAEPFDVSYCKRWCGPSIWTNFGGFTQFVGTNLECDIDGDGTNDAYSLAGNWVAEQVTIVDAPQ